MRFGTWFVVFVLGMLLAGSALAGQETTYTNAKGKYVGKQDAAGRFVDAKGNVRGREDEKGRLYDKKGRFRGQETRDTVPLIRQQSRSGN